MRRRRVRGSPKFRGPVALPADWARLVEREEAPADLATVRGCVNHGTP
jgi:hypothetical protein